MSEQRIPSADDLPAVLESFAALKQSEGSPVNARELGPPCRCGLRDESPLGSRPVRRPVVDLSDADGFMAFESLPLRLVCAACTHTIHPGSAAVVWRLGQDAGVFRRYHPECVDLS